jgi:ABC-type transport system involved in multi-copper enzyme maturation permease subunit
MKFLAILKDSLREAIDCKVLYVMVGLSALVTLFVASFSFKPLPAKTMMGSIIDGDITTIMDAMQGKQPEKSKRVPGHPFPKINTPYQLKELRVLEGKPDSPDSRYALTISMPFLRKEEAAKIRKDPNPALEQLKTFFAPLEKLKLLKITRSYLVPAAGEDSPILFEVETEPTEVTRRAWLFELGLFFGAVPLEGGIKLPLGIWLFTISNIVLFIGSWVTILTSIIITAFFIPNMLRKGTVDLMIVKPIQRWSILLYKYLGGLTFIFLNTTVAIVGIWLALGLRSGVWANSFLFMIFIITFFFAILYVVSTLFAVLTRSPIVAILMTCAAWFLFFIVGTLNQVFENQRLHENDHNVPAEERWGNNAFATVIKGIHTVTPRTSDLNYLGQKILLSDFLTGTIEQAPNLDRSSIRWGESLTVSGIFVAFMLGLACWWFATKDF